VCEFLDEPFDRKRLEFYQLNATAQLEPQEFLQWKARTLEAADASGVGRFRRDLSLEEVRAFEDIAGPMLAAYGYV
jgi:hypothetical protein